MAEIIRRWCSSEKEKYSPDLIDQLNEYKNSLLPIAEKNKDKKGKNIPSTMIINHFTKSYPHPKVLVGAYKLEYFVGESPNGKIRIYNLYDEHKILFKHNKEHMFVSDWIIEILKNSDVFIDVFLEYDIPFKGHNLKKEGPDFYNQGEMMQTVDKLEDCMFYKKCPTPNSRVHGVDIRKLEYIISGFEKIIRSNKGDYLTELTIKSLREYLHNILQSKKIRKQLRNAPECMREIVTDVILKVFNDRLSWIKKFNVKTILEDPYMRLSTSIGTILMDVYLLGRLFRKFDIRPSDKGMPENVQNAIIYTGGLHSIFYSYVFKQCGFKLKFTKGFFDMRKGENQIRELDISKLDYPLFRD